MPAEILVPAPHVATPFSPRYGQWLAFRPPVEIAGAHLTPDGLTVGIFARAQRPMGGLVKLIKHAEADPNSYSQAAANDAAKSLAQLLPARIMVVDADGCNLPKPQVKGQAQGNWWFTLDQVSGLRPVESREHLPPGREYHPDWKPEA